MAAVSKAIALAALAVLFPPAAAQQFPDVRAPYGFFDLTPSCLAALNTTLECSGRLAFHSTFDSPRVDVLDDDGIAAICNDGCRASMQSLRSKIQEDCDPITDLLDHGLTLFPATYILDRYIYTFDISCYRHRDTGDFCDHVLSEWRNQTDDSPHDCDDCVLGPMEIEVNSKVGHTKERAAEFQSATSSCGKTVYTYPYSLGSFEIRLSPVFLGFPRLVAQFIHDCYQYSLSAGLNTTSAEPKPTAAVKGWSAHRMSSDCAFTYHVREGDTCSSISANQSVSTRGLIEANDVLDGWCGGLEPGQDLCMPQPCRVHLVKPGDSCESLREEYGAEPKDLAKWNPMIYIQCDYFEFSKATFICVGPPEMPKKALKTPSS